jgi:hypothetical protein
MIAASRRWLWSVKWRRIAAEIAITTVGILIALAVNAAWQEREDRKRELVALREITSALVSDTLDINADLARYAHLGSASRILLRHVQEERPYEPSVDSLLGSLYIKRNHLSNSGAYESLKSMGISLIGDDSLRLAILSFYELRNREMAIGNQDGSDLYNQHLTPYLMGRVLIYKAGPGSPRLGAPVAYDALSRDPTFRGLLGNIIDNTDDTVELYEGARVAARQLLARISARIHSIG